MCVYSIYIIAQKENLNLPVSFKASIDYIETNSNGSCQYIRESRYAFCGESKLSECRNCKRESCSLIQCGVENDDADHIDNFKTLYELCVPLSITDKKKKKICRNFNGVNTYRAYNECFFDNFNKFQFLTYDIYIVIILIILAVSFIIIYYNVYLIKKKQEPFSPPQILPKIFFPSYNSDYERMKSDDDRMMKHTSYNYFSP